MTILSRLLLLGPLLLPLFTPPRWADAEPKSYRVVAGKSQAMFDATYPLGDFAGATDEVTGEIRVDPANIPQGVVGRVTANPARLRTGSDGRDRDLRKTLQTDRYGEILFTVGEVKASFPSLAQHADVSLTIAGVLRIRGVDKATTWTGRARLDGASIWVRGEAEIKLTDFGIAPPKKLFLAVGDTVRAGFDFRLVPLE